MRLLGALTLAIAVAGPVAAQTRAPEASGLRTGSELRFVPARQGAPEIEVLRSAVPDAVRASGVAISTLILDIDSDRTNDLAARFVSDATCDQGRERCRTVLLRFDRNRWSVIFDRRVERVELGSPGFGGVFDLRVDRRETWTFRNGRHVVDVARSGSNVAWQDPPPATVQPLIAEFGDGAQRLAQSGARIRVRVAALDVGGSGQVVAARLEGDGVCGRVLGCPTRILRVVDGRYQTLLRGASQGALAVTAVTRGGYRDILAETPAGHLAFGWTGETYAIMETEGQAR